MAKKPSKIEGQKIKLIRHATDEEADSLGFDHERIVVIELENGTLLCPSRDCEGNGPGVFFTLSPDGSSTTLE